MPNQDIGAVQRAQEYFRLKQIVQSPGDIYEIDESSKAIYIGPDSDIGEVQVTYFNPDEPLSLETAVVSVNGPFVGRIDALMATNVSSTGQPARILVSPVDVVDNAYVPPASAALRRFNIPAVIDLMVALQELPELPAVRADRTLRFSQVPYDAPTVPPPDDGSTDLIIPIYGRRMVTVTVIGNGADVQISLVTLLPGVATDPRFLGLIQLPSTLPVTKIVRTAVIRASDAARQGVNYDLAAVPTGYFAESDQPPNDPLLFGAFPRGMADLLLINIKSPGAPPGTTHFIDVFVKIADRKS